MPSSDRCDRSGERPPGRRGRLWRREVAGDDHAAGHDIREIRPPTPESGHRNWGEHVAWAINERQARVIVAEVPPPTDCHAGSVSIRWSVRLRDRDLVGYRAWHRIPRRGQLADVGPLVDILGHETGGRIGIRDLPRRR